MSEITQTDRDQRSGRFLSGCKPGPGRQRGSRNRLADAFVTDLAAAWSEYGEAALKRCATEEPGTFVKVIASLMPKDINLNVVDAATFADRFRAAVELLGNAAPPRPRPPLPGQPRVIEHDDPR